MTMCIAECNHAYLIALVYSGDTCKSAAVIPVKGKVIGQHQVHDATLEATEDRPIRRCPTDLPVRVAGLEINAAKVEVADSRRPDAPQKAVKLLRRELGAGINHSMNSHDYRRFSRESGAGGYRSGPEELAPDHSLLQYPEFNAAMTANPGADGLL